MRIFHKKWKKKEIKNNNPSAIHTIIYESSIGRNRRKYYIFKIRLEEQQFYFIFIIKGYKNK